MKGGSGLGLLIVSLLAAGAGCAKQESGTVPAVTGDKGKTAVPGTLGSDLGKAAGQAAAQAREQIASGFSTQLQQQQQQAQALRTDAKQYADQQLDGLLKNLEEKLAAASDKLNQIRNAEEGSAKSLQAEIQKLLGEAGDLYKQAKDRLAQLAKS